MDKEIFSIIICMLLVLILFSSGCIKENDDKDHNKDSDNDGHIDIDDEFPNNPILWDNKIHSNSTWTLEYSPYVISSDFIIPKGLTLTIEPGVIIKLSGIINTKSEFNATDFNVYGTIIAKGTQEKMIKFTTIEDPDQEIGYDMADWGEIDIKETSKNSIVDHCIIEYGYNGLVIDSKCQISNNIIRYCGNVGLGCDEHFKNSEISNNLIEECGCGITGKFPSSLQINNNTIKNNRYSGIVCDNADFSAPTRISHNLIIGNQKGIYIYNRDSHKIIINNNISQNTIGIECEWSCYNLTISNNTIMENKEFEIYTQWPINAEYNYWGTTNKTAIASKLKGNVDYEPCLEHPPDC